MYRTDIQNDLDVNEIDMLSMNVCKSKCVQDSRVSVCTLYRHTGYWSRYMLTVTGRAALDQ